MLHDGGGTGRGEGKLGGKGGREEGRKGWQEKERKEGRKGEEKRRAEARGAREGGNGSSASVNPSNGSGDERVIKEVISDD